MIPLESNPPPLLCTHEFAICREQARLAETRGWEIALASAPIGLHDAVRDRALRLEELASRRDWLPVPEAERRSQLEKDDDREWAKRHGDFTVQHQAGSRLIAAFEHLVDHSEGWRVFGESPPFHVSPEFAVLQGALEATSATWWLLAPEESSDRVLRSLSSKKQEAIYEAAAMKLKCGGTNAEEGDFVEMVTTMLESAAQEVGSNTIMRFPNFTKLADKFGGVDNEHSVGICWRECSSYAHGFDWASWRHREGRAESTVPYVALAETFVVAFDALHTLWTKRWLPLASAKPARQQPAVLLPGWPVQPKGGAKPSR